MQRTTARSTKLRIQLDGGFTLIELLIVLALLSICLGMLLPTASIWAQRNSDQQMVGQIRRSLTTARESAIRTSCETTWDVSVFSATSANTAGLQINCSPRTKIVFQPDGTANSDYRLELFNSQDQLIEALVIVGATGSVQLARIYESLGTAGDGGP